MTGPFLALVALPGEKQWSMDAVTPEARADYVALVEEVISRSRAGHREAILKKVTLLLWWWSMLLLVLLLMVLFSPQTSIEDAR